MVSFFNFLIRWSFYLLFILVPLIFTSNTSELFEFNKMWVTFGLTIIITASWISKMFMERRFIFTKTLLTIPFVLFLLSQGISTIFSMDPHTSLWGYYSRFNGGLYSLISYALLYFAFVSNIQKKDMRTYIYVSIFAGVIVALWGLPSHFGYDPTCLLFRGTFDVSCWTTAFQPKVRIFSTLGQPDWLAAYLVYLLPLTTAFSLIFWKNKHKFLTLVFVLITSLFYVDLLYTRARSGFAGFLVSIGIFILFYIVFNWRSFAKHAIGKAIKNNGLFLIMLFLFTLITFFIGSPLSPFDKFSFSNIQTLLAQKKTADKLIKQPAPIVPKVAVPVEELGGTDSGKIRLFVWQGALEIFLHNPLFGTGVETFAYSYYQYRPAGHNLTSEWDYLYNKAHNEYLNYLATTGIIGFGTYMIVIGYSVWLMVFGLWKTKDVDLRYLLLAMLASYVSILITNFFGFSVVIMNIFLFLTPAFVYFLLDETNAKSQPNPYVHVNETGYIGIGVVWLLCLYLLVVLIRFYLADISYAYGENLDNVNQFNSAYPYLHDAVAVRPSEPTFQNELAINDAMLAAALFQQKDTTNGTKLKNEAIFVSDQLIAQHPNVITYWKSRVRIFYTLAQIDPQYIRQALTAIQQTATLAPTDAKVWYNLGLLYDQTGDVKNAIATMQQTIKLKADYRDAYYALALFYRQDALGGDINSKQIKNPDSEKKAVAEMHFILANFGPGDDLKIQDTLKAWGEE